MSRGKTAGTVLAFIVTVLLALPALAQVHPPVPAPPSAPVRPLAYAPPPAPVQPSASARVAVSRFAHTGRRAEVRSPAGAVPAAPVPRVERAVFRDCGPAGNPTGPLRTRDRHRAVDCGPEAPERSALRHDPAASRAGNAPGVPDSRAPRPRPGRTPAALQVFRC
ncbi:hypothetical protein [Streptomyces anandii]|uniref:Uncharacterized protein n=1 Tax=Streptomyces anandii TaxID=285454 RepID=A0ABW6HAX2_9ACTN